MPINLRGRREKVFGPGRAAPLDRNAKVRIEAYVRAYNARTKQPRQHCGPITHAFQRVLKALLWIFHNSRSGCCFPSYEAIAAKAECERSTVAEALKALEWAGVLTWQNRITRIASAAATCSAGRAGAGASSARPMPASSTIRSSAPEACRLLSRKIRLEHPIKTLVLYLLLSLSPRVTRTTRSNGRCSRLA